MKELLPNIYILTGAYDDQYLQTRQDNPSTCTSAGKRIILYKAIEEAVGRPVVLLSPQPRGRGVAKPLPEKNCRFGAHSQFFAKASGVRRVRFALDILHYARHVARHTRAGDILVIDNYELIYVLAIRYCQLLGRRNPIILEYEDGKHLIDKGIWRQMSGLAERMARPWLEGAILASPKLEERLPSEIPRVLVPGILCEGLVYNPPPPQGQPVRFLYSGSLDVERGGPLLVDYLELGRFPDDIEIHITGQGNYTDRLISLQNRFPRVVRFHGIVSQEELAGIRSRCHYGLNLQSSTHPISTVTYPSKTFDYLNAGLRVISTRAAGVPDLLSDAAIYLDKETPEALAALIKDAADNLRNGVVASMNGIGCSLTYPGTVARLATLFRSVCPEIVCP